jgi:hypothetical protein
MVKTAAKNKTMFYIASAAIAFFLAFSFVPRANAQDLDEDIIPPDDVENVQIQVFDQSAVLSWDVATDNVGVEGYNIYYGTEPVTAESGEYTETIDAGDVIEYLVEGLENEETYYFAVTAYDAAGNESENYSEEVSGTPDATYGPPPARFDHEAADEEPPAVSDAQALDNETVQVMFSEAVVLPPENPENAFSIINNATSEELEVMSVEMDPEDPLGQTVLLTTAPQEAGAEYVLTAGIQIEDTAGNPIVSGTSDTAAFIGSTVEPGEDLTDELPEEDLVAPSVVSAASIDATSVQVIFSEAVILSSDPETNFFIAEEDNALNTLDILGVELDETASVVTLETSEQENVMYNLVVTDVLDENGNEIDDEQNSATFEGNIPAMEEPEEPDEMPDEEPDFALSPENVRNLMASIVRDMVVRLTWDLPEDPSIVDLVLYKSTDGGDTYDTGTSLGADREEVEVTGLTPGQEYFFKLTTMDDMGNESDGMVTSITLPETGMGLGLLAGASIGLAALRKRRNK